MTKEFLEMLREEVKKDILGLRDYNEYARRRNKLAEEEEIKKELGLPYRSNLWIPEKTEDGIIISTYRKHIDEIEEQNTNQIYYYDGTYKYILEEEEDCLGITSELVPKNDLSAEFRRYQNIEGIYSYDLALDEADAFEKTHIVLFPDNPTIHSVEQVTNFFVSTAVKENQEKAISWVLKKYNTKRK